MIYNNRGRFMKTYDGYEIHPCKDYGSYIETCHPDEADFWSLYGHLSGEGVECIGDFNSFDDARSVYYRITGKQY
jgi:hypothetical protein